MTKAPKLRCCGDKKMARCAVIVRLPYGDAAPEKILFPYSLKLAIFLIVCFNTSSACHILAFVGSIHGRVLECFFINFIFSVRRVSTIFYCQIALVYSCNNDLTHN